MTDPLRIFIDANVLAAPLTRTLLLSAAQSSGYTFTWSAQAEAEGSESRFLLTNNVDDFDHEDLHAAGVSAATADMFMSHRVNAEGYRQALNVIARGQKNPPITTEDLHRSLSKVHPRLFAAQNGPYRLEPLAPRQKPPAVEYRGTRCVRCDNYYSEPTDLHDGLGTSCCHVAQ